MEEDIQVWINGKSKNNSKNKENINEDYLF